MAKPRNKRYKYESDTSVMENKPPQWFPLLTELLVLATMTVRKDGNRTGMMGNPASRTKAQL